MGSKTRSTKRPQSGAPGLAIKSYLSLHIESGRVADDAAALGDAAINYEVHASILKDAVRFVPELAPLAAHTLATHAALRDRQVEKLETQAGAGLPMAICFGEPEEGGAA
jgi:hypothetical protein